MLRILSILLIVFGLGLAGLGVAGYLAREEVPRLGEGRETPPADAPPPPRAVTADRPSERATDFETRTVQPAGMASNLVEELRRVPIAHETPAEAQFGRSFEVSLAIDATGRDSAAGALPGEGRVVEGTAQVSEVVTASLTGPAFEIESLSPARQAISPFEANMWRWSVRPLETGAHDLVIEIFAVAPDETVLPVRTFRDTVTVKVSYVRQLVSFAQDTNPLFMVLGGIGSALGGLFGAARFFRK